LGSTKLRLKDHLEQGISGWGSSFRIYMHTGNNFMHSALDMNKLYHCHEIIVLNVM